MKWLLGFAAGLFASATLAAPVGEADEPIQIYKLRISARPNTFLDGKYLSIREDNVGVFNDGRPVNFYTSPSPRSGLVQLHTWPIGYVDSVLGLVGTNGLTALTQISNPAAVTFPVGVNADWTSWRLVEADDANQRVGLAKRRLDYAGSRGRWVAFPKTNDEWVVTWLEGVATVTQNYLAIDVTYEPVPDAAIDG